MLETAHGEFELIKDYRDAFVLDDFNKRYLDVFDIYQIGRASCRERV